MKKIIDGKLYSTDTGTEICSNGFSNEGDFNYWRDTLYCTKKGTYFMHGTGGALSHYAQHVGNNTRTGSEEMWIIEDEKAKQFCMSCDVEKALELFPDDIEEG